MCKGLGLDLCQISRMEELAHDERFLARYFTEEEAAYIASRGACAAQTTAGIFAAKEAFVKALGVGVTIPMRDVGVTHTVSGQPCYALTGKAAELASGCTCMLSISHEADMAVAVCIIFANQEHQA